MPDSGWASISIAIAVFLVLFHCCYRTDKTMKVEIRDNKLYIEIDLQTPTPSGSGKTLKEPNYMTR